MSAGSKPGSSSADQSSWTWAANWVCGAVSAALPQGRAEGRDQTVRWNGGRLGVKFCTDHGISSRIFGDNLVLPGQVSTLARKRTEYLTKTRTPPLPKPCRTRKRRRLGGTGGAGPPGGGGRFRVGRSRKSVCVARGRHGGCRQDVDRKAIWDFKPPWSTSSRRRRRTCFCPEASCSTRPAACDPGRRRCGSPSSDSRMAIQRVPSNWARISIAATVSGVDRNMPVTPTGRLQTARDSGPRSGPCSGCRPACAAGSRCPPRRRSAPGRRTGSGPARSCRGTAPGRTAAAGCSRPPRPGSGCRRRTKIRKAQNSALSRRSSIITTQAAAAIIKPVTVWIHRYCSTPLRMRWNSCIAPSRSA